MEPDPIGYGLSLLNLPNSNTSGINLNLYAYAGNDPLNFVDPMGTMQIDPPYGNWGGDGWTNHRPQSELTNFPWRKGQKGFKQPWNPRDNCYYKHDVCLHNCARIQCPEPRRRCRRICDRDLADCLREVLKKYGNLATGKYPEQTMLPTEINLFGGKYHLPNWEDDQTSPNDTVGEYVPNLKFYDPNYDPGVRCETCKWPPP